MSNERKNENARVNEHNHATNSEIMQRGIKNEFFNILFFICVFSVERPAFYRSQKTAPRVLVRVGNFGNSCARVPENIFGRVPGYPSGPYMTPKSD